MPQEIKSMVIAFDAKSVSDVGQFEGYGSVFGNVDLGGDRIAKGAFRDSLAEWSEKGQMPAMFWFHNSSEPIGEWLEMREDEHGLYVKGQLWVEGNPIGRRPIERAEQVRNLLTSNGPKGLSIGYGAKDYEFSKDESTGNRIRDLKAVKLYETSPVPFGMNPMAEVTSAKSLCGLVSENGEIADPRSFERLLRDAGLSQSQAKRLMADGYKALRQDVDQRDADRSELISGIQSITNSILHR